MVKLSVILLGTVVASTVNGAPLRKRIAQNIVEATAKWEQACLAAGGGLQCNPISVASFSSLLAAPGPCDQQNAADDMIDLAKTLGNDAEMIKLAQIFVQQPRNTPTSLSVPYCQQAPSNSELNGLFQCQFQGANPTVFVGGAAVGQAGTIPFGLNAPLSPPGSCPANPSGPIPDGQQLVDITQNPGAGSAPAPAPEAPSTPPPADPAPAPAPATPAPAPAPAPAGGDFKLSNGQAAQALNAKFTTLTADSPCTAGENACVDAAFAQCVDGKFVVFPCGGGLTCAALPLVNSPGTSLTCTTVADAETRIAATGATGGLTGNGAAPPPVDDGADDSAPAPAPAPATPAPAPAPAAAPAGGDFKLSNGQAAQALNAKFATLTADSACTAGENACVDDAFAQCVDGKFVVFPCGGGLTCAALPLVNSPGTSITCTTEADAVTRIQATGASGGLTGA